MKNSKTEITFVRMEIEEECRRYSFSYYPHAWLWYRVCWLRKMIGLPNAFFLPNSNLSVPSNTVQSVQSSYNPFEDEEDTGSTVSEKEDNKIKKLVKDCSQIVFHAYTFLSRVSNSGFPQKHYAVQCMKSLLTDCVLVANVTNILMLYHVFVFLVGFSSLVPQELTVVVCFEPAVEAMLRAVVTGCVPF